MPLRDLRIALANPKAYVRMRRTAAPAEMRATKFGTFRNAVFEYHKSKGDALKAQRYLESKFTTFADKSDLPDYLNKLNTYVNTFEALGTEVVRIRCRISIPLPGQYSDFKVTGEVPRIDLAKPDGYSVWMFVRDDPGWSADPRMPLLQDAIAGMLNVHLGEVGVGVYDFVAGQYFATRFKSAKVELTRKNLFGLLAEFAK